MKYLGLAVLPLLGACGADLPLGRYRYVESLTLESQEHFKEKLLEESGLKPSARRQPNEPLLHPSTSHPLERAGLTDLHIEVHPPEKKAIQLVTIRGESRNLIGTRAFALKGRYEAKMLSVEAHAAEVFDEGMREPEETPMIYQFWSIKVKKGLRRPTRLVFLHDAAAYNRWAERVGAEPQSSESFARLRILQLQLEPPHIDVEQPEKLGQVWVFEKL